jgi:uncharacterized protein (DUF1800 family)
MLSPLPPERWNRASAAHLLNRAGFGGPPADIDRLAARTPEAAVRTLVDWDTIPDSTPSPAWARPDPDRAAQVKAMRQASGEERIRLQRERARVQRERLLELQHGWLERMTTGPRPLQEKLTLFWHGHFATSFTKVKDAYLLWRQNEVFRTRGGGSWRRLLEEVTRDPAMLVWLDQAQSRPPHPNENYARELLELFTLGEGHYSERDVTEGARALTGLTLDRLTQEPVYRPRLHDAGTKTFLGRTGPLGWEAVLDQIVQQPAADRFITGKLWHYFAGSPPSPALHNALADAFRASDRQFRPFLHTLFRSEAFYAPEVVRQQIKSPVQLLVMACRELERPLPPPRVCTQTLRGLGQELFNPPNVRGWEGGVAWINTNTLLLRHNLALLLVTGQTPPAMAGRSGSPPGPAGLALRRIMNRRNGPVNLERLLTPEDRSSPDRLVQAVDTRFLQGALRAPERKALREYLAAQGDLDENDLLGLIRLTLCTPEYQLT